jgi:hypothetical protein
MNRRYPYATPPDAAIPDRNGVNHWPEMAFAILSTMSLGVS